MDAISTPRLVVGIDFGTHASAFAFARRNRAATIAAAGGGGMSHVRVSTHDQWPDQPSPSVKTRTALLYKGDRVVAWGWTAWKRWGEMSPHERRTGPYSYLENFKLLLEDGADADVDTVCSLPPGVTRVQAVADYLAEMRKYAQDRLKNKAGIILSTDETVWCLTLPAIWSDAAKARMRDAAHRAGLVNMDDTRSLVLTLEPEAAALSAVLLGEDPSALNPTGLQQVGAGGGGDGSASASASTSLHDGDVMLVLDCGGGTADATLHEVRGSDVRLRLEEAAVGRGALAGGAHVDAAAMSYMRELLGPDPWDTWKEAHPAEFARLATSWELEKHKFRGDELSPAGPSAAGVEEAAGMADMQQGASSPGEHPGGVRLPLPWGLLKRLESAQLQALSNPLDPRGYAASDQTLVLPAAVVAARIFDPVVQDILGIMQGVIDEGDSLGSQCGKVLLAGGFARSPYLKSRVARALPGGVLLLSPVDPAAAVVTGAVFFGALPTTVTARRCRYSYGVGTAQPWTGTDAVHAASSGTPEKKWNEDDRCYYAHGAYHPFVRRGELIRIDRVFRHSFRPLSRTDNTISFSLYKTSNNSARYVREPGMERLAEVVLQLPSGWKWQVARAADYIVEVEMRFGATELSLVAFDSRTRDAVAANVVWNGDKV